MTTIPIAWVIAILVILLATTVLSRRQLPLAARVFFAVGLLSIAVVTGFVGLRLEYGWAGLSRLQPHFSIIAAPALWLGFRALMEQDMAEARLRRGTAQGVVLGVVLAQVALLLPLSWSMDVVVLAVNVLFAGLLARLLRCPPERFVHVAPQNLQSVRVALAGATVFVLLIVAGDVSILAATLSAGDAGMMAFLTGASGVLVICVIIGAFIGIPLALGTQKEEVTETGAPPAPVDQDRALFDRIETTMAETQIYTDANLTLARLGRRLGVPARDVSQAVNRVTGDNISRYINGHRVRRAAELLRDTELSITDVMLEAGFQSKSTFNTEFRRLHDQTPSAFRKQVRDGARVRDHDSARPTS